MCYSGSVFCVCCNREFDNPGPNYVSGCGCTSNKCDDCIAHGPCKFTKKKGIIRVIGDCG